MLRRFTPLFLLQTLAWLPALAQQVPPADSVTVAIEPTYTDVSGVHRLLFGNSYRQEWATPTRMPVFHLATEKGGLKILKIGGDGQTKSLRLQDPTGQEWVLRTIQKYPEKGLPPSLRPTIVKAILQDQVSSSHPFAALVVPPLAQALGVPHAHPRVVFVPDDPALGEYRKVFANQVFQFEEREPLDADKTDNTEKTEAKLQKNNDNRVNQHLVLRARLLDMLLGDYDRHEDQWRWLRNDLPGGGIRYEPVPRDRDHVFYQPSGVLLWALSHHLLKANTQGYSGHIRSITRWNSQARYFDRYFLNQLSESDWRQEISYVQQHLPDSLLRRALHEFPAAIYPLSGPEILRKLQARRDGLLPQALRYYRFLSKNVDVPASDKRELLTVQRQPDGFTAAVIQKKKKDGTPGDTVYQRRFDPAVTHEVRLYGLGGADSFAVAGAGRLHTRVRLIGGAGPDVFAVAPDVGPRRKLRIYDNTAEANRLPPPGRARLLLAADTAVNRFNPQAFRYSTFQPLVSAAYTADFGVQLIGNFVWTHQSFRKDPYAFRQALYVNYGTAHGSLVLGYTGEFKRILPGNNDLLVSVLSQGPNFTNHFFGVGNATANDHEDLGYRYYRNVYALVTADVRVARTIGSWRVSGGPQAQYYNAPEGQNSDRLLSDYNATHPEEKVFSRQIFGGLAATATLDTRDKGILARRGVYWTSSLLGLSRLDARQRTLGQFQTDFTVHFMPTRDSALVVAARVGGGTTAGQAAYFQQLKLGGVQNLRGYYFWRFTGRSMAYSNIDVHLKLATFSSYLLPGTLGLVAFNDVGRVWQPGETSRRWHDGYGGGLYFLPAQLLLVQAVVGFSDEGTYPYITVGLRI